MLTFLKKIIIYIALLFSHTLLYTKYPALIFKPDSGKIFIAKLLLEDTPSPNIIPCPATRAELMIGHGASMFSMPLVNCNPVVVEARDVLSKYNTEV